MKQQKRMTSLAPLVPISCSNCGDLSRLVGLEPALGGEVFADLCTYECQSCGEVQTRVFLRSAIERGGREKSAFHRNDPVFTVSVKELS